MYVYHRFNLAARIFPKSSSKNNAIKLVLQVPNECPPALSTKLSKRYFLISPNAKNSSEEPREILTLDHNQQAACSSSLAASDSLYGNNPNYSITKSVPPKENLYQVMPEKTSETTV